MSQRKQQVAQVVKSSLFLLESWVRRYGYKGYDPYDIKETALFHKMSAYLGSKTSWRVLLLFPVVSRKLLRVPKRIYPKAMGLFMHGFADIYAGTADPQYLAEARRCAEWLLRHYTRGYSGYCWGYPFHWRSRKMIPKDTPSSVVSVTVGEGFWNLYTVTQDSQYLDVCTSICDFIMQDLNRYEDGNTLCFSYTPIDNFQVHNANLMAAAFLAKVGTAIGNSKFVELAEKAGRFALREQNPDGSICYWSKAQSCGQCQLDIYHSGFEIRSLYQLACTMQDEAFEVGWQRYAEFFINNFFREGEIPKFRPSHDYPVDIHGCAEAILTLRTVGQTDRLYDVIDWVVKHMQTSQGWFVYRIYKVGKYEFKIRIPFIRWGQAWMFRALASAFRDLQKAEVGEERRQ